jgi:O-antigen/teichoic acid export membrane protein
MLRKFISDTSIYLIPSFISKVSGFILLLIYVRTLTLEEYGLVELILVTFSLLNMILPLEITQGVARFFRESSLVQREKIISTSLAFTALVFLFPILGSLLLLTFFEDFSFGASIDATTLILITFYMFFCSLQRLVENQLRWSLMPKEYSYLAIFGFISLLVFTWYFLYISQLNILGFVIASLLSSILSVMYGIYLISSKINLSLRISKDVLITLLNFSYPLVFSSAAFYVFNYSDRWMLQLFDSTQSVGLYGGASRIAILAVTIHILLRSAFMPLVYDRYKEAKTPEDISTIFSLITVLGLIMVGCISVYSKPLVTLVLGENYLQSASIVTLISVSLILMNSYFYAPGIAIAKKTKLIAFISLICALVNIIGNFFLIPLFSIKGAAISSVLASIILVGMYFFFGQREYKINYEYKFILLLLIFWTISLSLINIFVDKILFKTLIVGIMIIITLFSSRMRLRKALASLNLNI